MKQTFFTNLKTAWELFLKNRKLLLFTTLIEVMFFYFYTNIQQKVFLPLQGRLDIVMQAMGEQTANVTESIAPQLDSILLADPTVMAAYNDVLKFLGLFLLLILLNWILFQGINWWLANKIVKKKVDFAQYAKKFIAYTIFWFAALFLLLIFVVLLADYASFGILPLVTTEIVSFLFVFLLLAIAYFSSISYSLIPNAPWKQTWIQGAKNIRTVLPAFTVSIIILGLAGLVAFLLTRVNFSVSLLWVVVVALPSITFARIYFIKSLQ